MSLTITPITWTVRCGDQHKQYGDPYLVVATIQRCGDVAHVSAVCGYLPLCEQAELRQHLRTLGFAAVVFERVKNGKMRSFRRKL